MGLKVLINSIRLKKIILFIAFIGISTWLKAQNGYNYAPFGVQVEANSTRAYADLKKSYDKTAFNVNFVYNYSPFLPVAAELQFGSLSGGSNTSKTVDVDGRQFTNDYKALILHADLQVGEILDYGDSFFLNFVKNFYIGTGMGMIHNNMVSIQRTSPYDPSYTFPGFDKSTEFMIPLRFGYEIKIYNQYDEPSIAIDLGYRHNITFNEGLDGYNDPSAKFKNNALDQYRQITIGIKFNFGDVIAYKKNIRRLY